MSDKGDIFDDLENIEKMFNNSITTTGSGQNGTIVTTNNSNITSNGLNNTVISGPMSRFPISNSFTFNMHGQSFDDVQYIIVLDDDSCLEYSPPNTISLKEMLAVSQFFALATLHGISDVKFNWGNIIENLKIKRFFIPGQLSSNMYVDSKIKYIKLATCK